MTYSRHPNDFDYLGKERDMETWFKHGYVHFSLNPAREIVFGDFLKDQDMTVLKEPYSEKVNDRLSGIINQVTFLKWYQGIFGVFDDVVYEIFMMGKNDTLHWHNEYFTGIELKLVTWDTPVEYTREDGGLLEFCTFDIGKLGPIYSGDGVDNIPLSEDRKHLLSLVPGQLHGVLWNNKKADLVHRVTPLLTEKPRFGITIRFGYNRNGTKFFT